MEFLVTVPLLIIDDLGMRKLPLTAAEELLEIILRRYERASFEFPWANWRGGTVAADLRQREVKSALLAISEAQWLSQQEKQKRPNSLE